jgi:hypothetical protein
MTTNVAPEPVTLGCPTCREARLSTIERIDGLASISTITQDASGEIEYDFTGDTEVLWDTSTTVGVQCRSCDWSHEGDDWVEQLVAI